MSKQDMFYTFLGVWNLLNLVLAHRSLNRIEEKLGMRK